MIVLERARIFRFLGGGYEKVSVADRSDCGLCPGLVWKSVADTDLASSFPGAKPPTQRLEWRSAESIVSMHSIWREEAFIGPTYSRHYSSDTLIGVEEYSFYGTNETFCHREKIRAPTEQPTCR
jgi:hypothetical protein